MESLIKIGLAYSILPIIWWAYLSQKKLFETGRVLQVPIKEILKGKKGAIHYRIEFKDPMGAVISTTFGRTLSKDKTPLHVGDMVEIISDKDKPSKVVFNDPAILNTMKKVVMVVTIVSVIMIPLFLSVILSRPQ